MGFNEAVRNLNVRKYLSERDKLSCQEKAGHRKSVTDNPGDLLERQAQIQEREIAKALRKEDEICENINKENKSKGAGDGGGAGPH